MEAVRPGVKEAVGEEVQRLLLDVVVEVRRRLLEREGLVGRGEEVLRPAA